MNFSLSEMLVILLIALIVFKPEQLPGVAFTVGKMIRRISKMAVSMKEEMNAFIDSTEKLEQKRDHS